MSGTDGPHGELQTVEVLGVESETIGEPHIVEPFDPNLIRVRKEDFTVEKILEMMEHQEVDLAPEFQRHPDVWKANQKSKLIESVILRIPLPAIYLDEIRATAIDRGDVFSVVDGIQRLSALRAFVPPHDPEARRIWQPLRLTGLEFLSNLNEKTFDEIPKIYQRRIRGTGLLAYVIEPGTPSRAKLNIFKRLNTGGLTLTWQEIRHAMNPGPVRKLLIDLSLSDEFLLATERKLDDKRMDARECITRFFAFREGGWRRYAIEANEDFDGFLSDAMAAVNSLSDVARNELADRFKRAMRWAHRLFREWAFRWVIDDGSYRRSPINKALFEALAVSLDARSDAELNALKGESLIDRYVGVGHDLKSAITQGTGDRRKVRARFEGMHSLFEPEKETGK